MNPPPRLYVRVGPEIRGPYGPAQLRELAEVGVVTPETESATEITGPWLPLGATMDAPRVFPPRPEFGFNERTITRLNDDSIPPVDLQAVVDFSSRPLPAGPAQPPEPVRTGPPPLPTRSRGWWPR